MFTSLQSKVKQNKNSFSDSHTLNVCLCFPPAESVTWTECISSINQHTVFCLYLIFGASCGVTEVYHSGQQLYVGDLSARPEIRQEGKAEAAILFCFSFNASANTKYIDILAF